MVLLKIKIENLFSYKHTEIDFDQLNFSLFKGKNGVGKSSIFDIICWVLYGQTARKKYKSILRDLPLNDKPKVGAGTVWFAENDTMWKIVRSTNKTLVVYKNSETVPMEYRTQTMVQEHIEGILGVDFKTFLNIAYFSQGDVGKFLNCESSERIKIITDILQLDKIDEVKALVDKDIQGTTYEVEYKKGQISIHQHIVKETDIKELKREKSELKREFDELNVKIVKMHNIVKIIDEKRVLNDKRRIHQNNYNKQSDYFGDVLQKKRAELKKLKELKDKTEGINEELKELASKFADEKKLADEFKEVSEEFHRLESLEIRRKAEYSHSKSLIDELEEATGMLGKECPTCHNTVTEKNIIHLKDKIKSLKVLLDDERKNLERIIKNKETIFNRKMRIDNELSKFSSLHQKEFRLKQELIDIKKRKDVILTLSNEIEELKNQSDTQLSKISDSIKKIDAVLKKFAKVDDSKYDSYNDMIRIMEGSRDAAEKKISNIKHKEDQYWVSLKTITQLTERLTLIERENKIMMFWKESLPKIKIMMISNVIPFLEAETNKYLSQILPGKSIKFQVDPEKVNNKIDMMIYDYDNKVNRIFEGWSGGERDKMSLSVYFALNKLASLKSGKQINFLILDEKFASIDSESRIILFEMLKKEYEGRKIWAISHIKDIEQEFQDIVTIEKRNNISHVTIKNQYEK